MHKKDAINTNARVIDQPTTGTARTNTTVIDQSTTSQTGNITPTIFQSNQNKNLSDSVLSAIMKSGVIFPVVNKQLTDISVIDTQMKKQSVVKMTGEQVKKQTGSLSTGKPVNKPMGLQLTGEQVTKSTGSQLTGAQLLNRNEPVLSDEQVKRLVMTNVQSLEASQQKVPLIPVKTIVSPVNLSESSQKADASPPKGDVMVSASSVISSDPSMNVSNFSEDQYVIQSNNNTNEHLEKGTELNSDRDLQDIDQDLTESGDSPENSKLVCCDSQKCGVTVIPGTHEGLKKCCNAVVPKKRKRHFETKHTLSARQKLSRRLSGNDLTRSSRSVDSTKCNSGTIFIDLEPNEDGTLSQKSTSSNQGPSASVPVNEIGFQVSGLCRESNILSQGKSKGKGSVILQPGAVFSIPIAYSLTTQTDGSLRPLVISKHTFHPKAITSSESTEVDGKVLENNGTSSDAKNSGSTVTPHDNQVSVSDNLSLDNDEEKSGNGLEISTSPIDGGHQSRRRRYPTSRPFKCDKCDSAFNQRIHLKKHMSKHTGKYLIYLGTLLL